MKRTYQGNYFDTDQQGNEIPLAFRMEVEIDEKFVFTGTVWEEDCSGITDSQSSVKGFIDEDHISFVKQYPSLCEYDENGKIIINESRPGHVVIYDGYWDEKKGMWSGEWEVEGEIEVFQFDMIKIKVFLGKFEMNMVE